MAHILGAHLCSKPNSKYKGWDVNEVQKVALGYLNFAHQFAIDPLYRTLQIEPALFLCTNQDGEL
jgi:hypothetical protein